MENKESDENLVSFRTLRFFYTENSLLSCDVWISRVLLCMATLWPTEFWASAVLIDRWDVSEIAVEGDDWAVSKRGYQRDRVSVSCVIVQLHVVRWWAMGSGSMVQHWHIIAVVLISSNRRSLLRTSVAVSFVRFYCSQCSIVPGILSAIST